MGLALSCVPPQSLVLLEDIDAAFPSSPRSQGYQTGSSSLRNNRNLHTGSDVTFSGLLNVLDGVASSEERLVFMTTNFIEHLDSALIRPGRVDHVQYIGDASHSQARAMFMKFYPDSIELADIFANSVVESKLPVSMASLQGYFLRHKDSPEQASKCIQSFLAEEIKPYVRTPSDFSDSSPTPSPSSSSEPFDLNQKIDWQSPFSIPSNAPSRADDFQQFLLRKYQKNGAGIEQVYDSFEEEEAAEFERIRIEKAKRRPLTVDEVDKMVFNPQENWDEGIQGIDMQDESFFTGGKK